MGVFDKTKYINGKCALKTKYASVFSLKSVEVSVERCGFDSVLIKYNFKELTNQSDHPTGDLSVSLVFETLDKKETYKGITCFLDKLESGYQYEEIKSEEKNHAPPPTGNYNIVVSISEYTTLPGYILRYNKNLGQINIIHPIDSLSQEIAQKIFDNPNYENELKYGIPQYFYIKEKFVRDRIYLFRNVKDRIYFRNGDITASLDVKKGDVVGELSYCLWDGGYRCIYDYPNYVSDDSKHDEEIIATHDGVFKSHIKVPDGAMYYTDMPWVKLVMANALKRSNRIEIGVIHIPEEEFYKDNRSLITSYLDKLKEIEKQEQIKRQKEIEKQIEIEKQEAKKQILEEQAQKKIEREEESRETAFQKSLKSISEDIDSIELSVGKGVFNIQQLTILESHISVLCENKAILTENNKNTIQRKKKYLEVIFQDCKKLPDCKGSSKIRMEEILNMLESLSDTNK